MKFVSILIFCPNKRLIVFIYIPRITTYPKRLKFDVKRRNVQYASSVSHKLAVNYLNSSYCCQLSAIGRVSYVILGPSQKYILPQGFDDILNIRIVNLEFLLYETECVRSLPE